MLAPPGNILVFRMFHILVGATACQRAGAGGRVREGVSGMTGVEGECEGMRRVRGGESGWVWG